jgi:hypothetical protein
MIFLKGNVPSSKNSKQWTGKTLIQSKTVRNYLKEYEIQYKLYANKFKEMIKNKKKPYYIGFYFIRNSKRKFDYNNLTQLPQDLMVKYKWLEDDNADYIIPVGIGYEVNKANAGVIITVLDTIKDKEKNKLEIIANLNFFKESE